MTGRTAAAAAIGVFSLVAASGCRDLRGDAAVDRSSTLILASSSEEDAVLYGDARALLFMSLLRENDEGEIVGSLARSWTNSLDGQDWTFHLRSDVRWHDGMPVTARDIAFTFDLFSDPDVTVARPDRYGSVTAVDDTTLLLRSAAGWAPANWTWEIALPEHLLRDLDRKHFRSWDFWKAPVGNGPYRFARSLPATMMEFVANEEYADGRPAIDRVMIRFVGEAGFAEFLAGRLDVLGNVSATQALRIGRDPSFRLYHWFNADIAQAIHWRHDHPFFGDARVRRALTVGIDRVALMRTLHLPETAPVPDAFHTPRQFRRGELPPPLPHDPAEARRLLEEAGWGDADGDGVLDRDGQPFRFTLSVPQLYYGVGEAAVFLKDQYRRIGIVTDVQPLPATIATTRLQQGDFEAYLGFMPMVPDGIAGYFGGHERYRFSGYRNPRLIELARRAAATTDAVVTDSLYREMTGIFRAELPATPLFPLVVMSAAHRRVQGLSSPFRADPVAFITGLTLDDDPPAGGRH